MGAHGHVVQRQVLGACTWFWGLVMGIMSLLRLRGQQQLWRGRMQMELERRARPCVSLGTLPCP